MKKISIPKYIAVSVFLLIVVISYFFYNKSSDNYNNLKVDKSKHLIYTVSKTQSGFYNQYKPILNIKGEVSDTINNDIDEYYSNFNKDNICITYEYDLNGKVLSLIIKVEDYSYVESAAILYFRSYNIKLDNMEILSNEKILEYFDMTNEDVENKLNDAVYKYYTSLINKHSIDEDECDYDCFLKSREFQSGTEDNEYYIKEGKLVVFKPYVFMKSTDNEEQIVYDFEL